MKTTVETKVKIISLVWTAWVCEPSESGWYEDCWVGQMLPTNELFSHRNNFHGKIPQAIVRVPIQANI